MSSHGPLEEEVREVTTEVGRLINDVMPPNYGFALLVFGLGDNPGRMNYVSNANREDMVVALKELVANMEGRPSDQGGTA